MDLDNAQKECRIASSELFRVKSAYEESILQLDEVRKENKALSGEIKDIMDQISEGGRSIHEIDKIRKRLEAEKLELQSGVTLLIGNMFRFCTELNQRAEFTFKMTIILYFCFWIAFIVQNEMNLQIKMLF